MTRPLYQSADPSHGRPRLLIVEDDRILAQSLRKGLEEDGYVGEIVSSAGDAYQRLLTGGYSCCVVDVGLPDGSGVDLISRMRDQGVDVPVLVLSAQAAEQVVVAALDAGADEYCVKPVSLAVLEARVHSLIRRWRRPIWPVQRAGDLVLRPDTLTVTRGCSEVVVTPTQARLLQLLMTNPGLVLTRSQISSHLGNGVDESASNVVDVHVRALRTKVVEPLGCDPIETVRGVGYRFRPPVRPA